MGIQKIQISVRTCVLPLTPFACAECELLGDKVAGIAVHNGARVSALAGAGEVLVSETVRDLVAGSGIAFEDRGEHELKGVGERRIFAVSAV